MEKTILKLYSNGDFETFDTELIQSGNAYSFSKHVIQVPAIIKYNEGEAMPAWVRDTGHPVSFFPNGVVIKGKLIQHDNLIIFKDDFNRPDSFNLGNNWFIAQGRFAIEDNKVWGIGGNGVNNVVGCSHEHSDNVSISVDIKPNESESIIFRAEDSEDSNYIYAQFELGDLKLKQSVNGSSSILKTVKFNALTTRTYRVRVELRGTEIKVFVDNILYITHVTNTFINNTICGLQSWASYSNNGSFDNFEIRSLT